MCINVRGVTLCAVFVVKLIKGKMFFMLQNADVGHNRLLTHRAIVGSWVAVSSEGLKAIKGIKGELCPFGEIKGGVKLANI